MIRIGRITSETVTKSAKKKREQAKNGRRDKRICRTRWKQKTRDPRRNADGGTKTDGVTKMSEVGGFFKAWQRRLYVGGAGKPTTSK